MADDARPTRQRIIAEAMRLFGGQGYATTTIAQIESATGLSPGSGGLYRHFPSHASTGNQDAAQSAREEARRILEASGMPAADLAELR